MTQLSTLPETGPDVEFAEFLSVGEFKIQHCKSCELHIFYPRIICPHCGSNEIAWITPSGKGTVYSTSVPRGGKEGDYNIALVDLEEGPRMLTRVVNIAPSEVKIGMEVISFIGEVEGETVVLFRPLEDK
ncbi:MAG: Zn-ribbon domain-containing OB-fold protein [Cellvibrionaceae bacterium]